MDDLHFVFNERFERSLSAERLDTAALSLTIQAEETVRHTIGGSALQLDIPGAAAFVAHLDSERCVVFCLREISDGIEAVLCGIDPYAADRHPQVARMVRQC